jgi:hypothetical protein
MEIMPRAPVLFRRAILLSSFGLVTGLGTARAEDANKPDLQVGDRWSWQHTNALANEQDYTQINDVISVSPTEIRMRLRKKGTPNAVIQTFTPELNPIDTGDARWSPSLGRFAFPLLPGKKWNSTFDKMLLASGKHGKFYGKGEVKGLEKVTVPAGDFQAYKIVVTFDAAGTDENSMTGLTQETYWYAPEVRNYVKLDTTFSHDKLVRNQDLYELLEFSLR